MFCAAGFNFFTNHLPTSEYNYLEIGVFNGDSIAQIGRQNPNKVIYGVDPFIEDGCTMDHTLVNEHEFMSTQHENTMKNIEGIENVVLLKMTSIEFSETLTDELVNDMNVGWVLIDGSHHYADVINDCHLAMRLIGDRKGGIVFDDVCLPGVKQAHDEFLSIYKDRVSERMDIFGLHPGHILAYYINHDRN